MSFFFYIKKQRLTKRKSVTNKPLRCIVCFWVCQGFTWGWSAIDLEVESRRSEQLVFALAKIPATLLNIPHSLRLFSLHRAGSLQRQRCFFVFCFFSKWEVVRVGQRQTGWAGWGWEGQRSGLHIDSTTATVNKTQNLPRLNISAPLKSLYQWLWQVIGQQTHCGLWSFCPWAGRTHSHNTSHECADGRTDGRKEGDCDRKARVQPTPLIGISNIKMLYLVFCFFKYPLSDFSC